MRVDSYRYLPKSFQAFFASPEPLAGEADEVWSEFAPLTLGLVDRVALDWGAVVSRSGPVRCRSGTPRALVG